MYSIRFFSSTEVEKVHQAVQDVLKELFSKYVYKGTNSTLFFDIRNSEIIISSSDDSMAERIYKSLLSSMKRNGLDERLITEADGMPAGGGRYQKFLTVRNGISREESKLLIRAIRSYSQRMKPRYNNKELLVPSDSEQDAIDLTEFIKESNLPFFFQFEILSLESAA